MKKTLLSSLMALSVISYTINNASKGSENDLVSNLETAVSSNYISTPINYGDYSYDEHVKAIKKKYPEYTLQRIDSTLSREKCFNEYKFDKLLETMPEYQNLPELLVLYTKANARQESASIKRNRNKGIQEIIYFDERAVSRTGARGLLQFTRKWWPAYGTKNFDDAFDPEENLRAGAKFTTWLWNHLSEKVPNWDKKNDYDKLKYMAAAHNGGTGSLRRAKYDISKMRLESRNHAKKIARYYYIYNAEKKILAEYNSLRGN